MNNLMKMILIVVAAFSFTACGDDHDHENNDHNHENNDHNHENNHDNNHGGPEEEACEHMAEGPFEDVDATTEPGGAPSISFEHTRVNVTLLPTAAMDGFEGYVTFEADEAAEFVFFLSNDIPLMVMDGSQTEVMAESSETGSEFCTDVAKSYTYDLEVGTYTVFVGPTTEETVGFVVEEAGAHDDHDHE